MAEEKLKEEKQIASEMAKISERLEAERRAVEEAKITAREGEGLRRGGLTILMFMFC